MAIEEDAKHQARIEELARLVNDERFDEARPLLEEFAAILWESDTRIVSARWELSIAGCEWAAVRGDTHQAVRHDDV